MAGPQAVYRPNINPLSDVDKELRAIEAEKLRNPGNTGVPKGRTASDLPHPNSRETARLRAAVGANEAFKSSSASAQMGDSAAKPDASRASNTSVADEYARRQYKHDLRAKPPKPNVGGLGRLWLPAAAFIDQANQASDLSSAVGLARNDAGGNVYESIDNNRFYSKAFIDALRKYYPGDWDENSPAARLDIENALRMADAAGKGLRAEVSAAATGAYNAMGKTVADVINLPQTISNAWNGKESYSRPRYETTHRGLREGYIRDRLAAQGIERVTPGSEHEEMLTRQTMGMGELAPPSTTAAATPAAATPTTPPAAEVEKSALDAWTPDLRNQPDQIEEAYGLRANPQSRSGYLPKEYDAFFTPDVLGKAQIGRDVRNLREYDVGQDSGYKILQGTQAIRQEGPLRNGVAPVDKEIPYFAGRRVAPKTAAEQRADDERYMQGLRQNYDVERALAGYDKNRAHPGTFEQYALGVAPEAARRMGLRSPADLEAETARLKAQAEAAGKGKVDPKELRDQQKAADEHYRATMDQTLQVVPEEHRAAFIQRNGWLAAQGGRPDELLWWNDFSRGANKAAEPWYTIFGFAGPNLLTEDPVSALELATKVYDAIASKTPVPVVKHGNAEIDIGKISTADRAALKYQYERGLLGRVAKRITGGGDE